MNSYKKLLEKALPYYEKGRRGDINHINWLYNTIPRFLKETNLDPDIVMPLAILHDIGYASVQQKNEPQRLNVRKEHMKIGSEEARTILQESGYKEEQIQKICSLIAHHDDWAFGKNFSDSPELHFFQNFDFISMLAEEVFPHAISFKNRTPEEGIQEIQQYQEKNEAEGITWYNEAIASYYEELLEKRKKSL